MSPVLLIDNYDSFTFNLRHLLAAELGELPAVCRNDEIPFEALARGDFGAIVISPGPGRPEEAADFGGCRRAILEFDLPILGVCLGHQGIATAFGGAVERAPVPVHGEATEILHEGAPIFAGVPRRFEAVRYHSWVVAEPLPDCLEVMARATDGTVMALAHRERLIWGVQFHPESIGTPLGARIVRNFVAATRARSADGVAAASGERVAEAGASTGEGVAGGERPAGEARAASTGPGVRPAAPAPAPTWDIVVAELDRFPDPGRAFSAAFGAERNAFWLDDASGSGRSFIGASTGPGAELLTQEPDGESIFDVLRSRLDERRIEHDLPFDLAGGYVGYFGYGLKSRPGSPNRLEATTPDACFMAATEIVAFDHRSRRAWAIGLVPPGVPGREIEAKVDALRARLEAVSEASAAGPGAGQAEEKAALPAGPGPDPESQAPRGDAADPGPDPESQAPRGDAADPPAAGRADLALDHRTYLEAIAIAQRELHAGESYELCLTNRLSVEIGEVDPFALFLRQRALNPAPYGAFLRFGELTVLSSSPERFLRIHRDGKVEARPVKGTRGRGAGAEDERLREELRASAKDRAENLMIVDLLRNDLSRVCEVGSVAVDELFGLETHPHVHQLVSTIRGRLRDEGDPLGCVEACFPGGSMTGAPKLRSMQILDRLEPEPRGIYSGALGYLGLGGGVDLSIVIRTAVLRDGVATVGSGGAVTVRSDPEDEWREMLLKARPTLDALHASAGLKVDGPKT
jgi:para-aminobenzoate synthetase